MKDSSLDYTAKDYIDKRMGLIGLGTYQIRDEIIIYEILDTALEIGYRFIDTAQAYGNEAFIANALKILLPKHGLTRWSGQRVTRINIAIARFRSDIFITTKISPANQGAKKCAESIAKSLERLQTEYIDLLLIHWPGCSNLDSGDVRNKVLRTESWNCMEKLFGIF